MADKTKTLAEALDEDIDKFMESLPKRPYKDGWAEDKWQEEMEKHPFFMTKPLNENEELPPLIEGLQQLKYDENENTPDELANTYKNDGNLSFKCQKYRDAVTNYSAGLRCDCSAELKATLFNNRAAANFFLQNYRSALADSENAVKLNPNYVKAKIRMAQCYYFLKKYEECIELCDELSSLENKDIIVELKKKALNDKKVQERDLRKHRKNEKKILTEDKQLLETIVARGLKCSPPSSDADSGVVKRVTNLDELQPNYGNLPLKRVYLDGEDLVWPVAFLYPVYNIFDCIQEFRESDTFENHLNEMLYETPEWDVNKKYRPNMINVYFQDEENKKFKVCINETLKQVLQHERFVITNGVPLFFILPRNSEEENDFLKN